VHRLSSTSRSPQCPLLGKLIGAFRPRRRRWWRRRWFNRRRRVYWRLLRWKVSVWRRLFNRWFLRRRLLDRRFFWGWLLSRVVPVRRFFRCVSGLWSGFLFLDRLTLVHRCFGLFWGCLDSRKSWTSWYSHGDRVRPSFIDCPWDRRLVSDE
jgi:hypothetical protein